MLRTVARFGVLRHASAVENRSRGKCEGTIKIGTIGSSTNHLKNNGEIKWKSGRLRHFKSKVQR
jgi:hypothetical protein